MWTKAKVRRFIFILILFEIFEFGYSNYINEVINYTKTIRSTYNYYKKQQEIRDVDFQNYKIIKSLILLDRYDTLRVDLTSDKALDYYQKTSNIIYEYECIYTIAANFMDDLYIKQNYLKYNNISNWINNYESILAYYDCVELFDIHIATKPKILQIRLDTLNSAIDREIYIKLYY